MTVIPLLLVAAILPACATPFEDPDGYQGSGDAALGPQGRPSFRLPERTLSCGEGLCPIAIGGIDVMEIDPSDWMHVTPLTTGEFELAMLPSEPWRQRVSIRALAAGTGSVELHAMEGDRERTFEHTALSALPVERVRLRPLSVVLGHFDVTTERLAWHASDPDAAVELMPPGAAITAPEYVIDASVALAAGSDPAVGDGYHRGRYVLGRTGTFDVVVHADSFGTRRFEVTVVDAIERIEARVVQAPRHPGDTGIVCFDAFTGDHEVVLRYDAYAVTVANGLLRENLALADNCIEAKSITDTDVTVTGEAHGVTVTVDLVVPPWP